MFSRKDVSSFINDNFEPTWEMVREVPKINIDFGRGRSITRTLHGNIATYVCTSNGIVIDGIPGIYDHATYLSRLNDFHSQAKQIASIKLLKDKHKAIRAYHSAQLGRSFSYDSDSTAPSKMTSEQKRLWAQLAKDTRINETKRRKQIYQLLKVMSPITPGRLKYPLYKDVLHADLTDPYLGVDKLLSVNYPFSDTN